jgi:excisionase family DNA binding protein
MDTQTLPRFVSSQQAAEALNLTRARIAFLIRTGALPATRLGEKGRWRIPVEAIERLARGEAP